MYVPEPFALTDRARIAEVLRRYDFALLVTAAEGRLQASHLPFLFDRARGEAGTLVAHLARANPQGRDLARLSAAGTEALVVFQGPHAYVSPNWYAPGPAVPTWNYVAVHAYGVPRLIEEPAQVFAVLERLVAVNESGRPEPWSINSQTPDYLARMTRGVVAFEIPVARLEAKAKMSQNKTSEDRRGVATALRTMGDPMADEVAALVDPAPEDA